MKHITVPLAFVCVLAYVGSVQAECCRVNLTLRYIVGSGTCADAGGRRFSSSSCTVTVCADGRPLVGTYCGRGSCNIFGCNCDGGCIKGDWQQSFLNNNRRQNIRVVDATWSS
ncbi:protein Diedel-like [Drosophila hydei]|uniref:Protein Diedel-like n=1 Tax=Drosophila hydei TaxID=7224 RepID=A0A6J1LLT5_DROHY|nr:protein Diedel-like [Drosophila hydei]